MQTFKELIYKFVIFSTRRNALYFLIGFKSTVSDAKYANSNKIYFVSCYKNALDKSQWIHTMIVILV